MNSKSNAVGGSLPPFPSTQNQVAQAATEVLPDELMPMRLKAVATRTDVCVKTVRRWIERGLLRSYKLGGVRVVRKCDLRAFLDQQAGELDSSAP